MVVRASRILASVIRAMKETPLNRMTGCSLLAATSPHSSWKSRWFQRGTLEEWPRNYATPVSFMPNCPWQRPFATS